MVILSIDMEHSNPLFAQIFWVPAEAMKTWLSTYSRRYNPGGEWETLCIFPAITNYLLAIVANLRSNW
jgi:hypothetical protein